ncbi:MAG: hypothetical protein KDB21_16515 [Acidimicrobiales bacterium]|nr:hypothetical protein [Acidimicrobiales bacterium]
MRVLHHRMRALPLERLFEQFPDVTFVEIPHDAPLTDDIRGEVCFTTARGGPHLAEVLAPERGVRWVHTFGTGVDGFPLELIGDQVLTCSRGASAIPIAEWCLAMMLAFEKRVPDIWLTAPPERWFAAPLDGLYGKTVGIVGLGTIGQAVATRALAFGMEVVALRRTAAPSPVDGVKIVTGLHELLADSDHLVVAAPSTPDTAHLLDAAAFAAVKPGAHLVNIARGELVDQDALRAALDEGRVACASLDTVTPEPLPEGHWMYGHPGVRLSAHVSWNMPEASAWQLETFTRNLRRWIAGEALEAVVDLTAGY